VIQSAQDSLPGDLVKGEPLAVAAWAGEKTDQADEPACENRPGHPPVPVTPPTVRHRAWRTATRADWLRSMLQGLSSAGDEKGPSFRRSSCRIDLFGGEQMRFWDAPFADWPTIGRWVVASSWRLLVKCACVIDNSGVPPLLLHLGRFGQFRLPFRGLVGLGPGFVEAH